MLSELPKFQKAACIVNPGESASVRICNNVIVPVPGPHEILVKLAYSGICGSEIRALRAWSSYNPIVGHEGVGTVVKLGPSFSSVALGDRVGVTWLWSACGECSACHAGSPNYCPRQVNTGRHVPGTFQQFVAADSRYVVKLSEHGGVPDESVCPLLCAGLTMIGAVDKLQGSLVRGDWVVVLGAGGGLGHLGVQIASRVRGFRVIAIDHGPSKRGLSLESGAEYFIDFVEDDVEVRVKAITGEGAPAVIVASGSEAALEIAASLTRTMGTIVITGLPRNDFVIPLPSSACSARGLNIVGIAIGTDKQMLDLLGYVSNGLVVPNIEVINFEDIPAAFHRVEQGQVVGRLVAKIPQQLG